MVTKKTEGEHANPAHTEAVVNAISEVMKNLDIQKEGADFTINSNINSNNNDQRGSKVVKDQNED